MSLIDIAVVGHLDNSLFLAAIALGGTVFNMVYWLLSFLRTGTSGLTSQAFGAARLDLCRASLIRAVAMAAIMATVILLSAPWICSGMMTFMDADDAVRPFARLYFMTALAGAPAVLGMYALSGWFTGMQDSKPILYMSLTSNSLNIVLNLFFVFVMKWSIQGVAAATAIGQWAGFLYGMILCRQFLKKHSVPRLSVRHAFNKVYGPVTRLFSINFDIFLRTLCLVAVTVWFTRAGSGMGTDTLGANAVLMQLFMLFSFFIDGFAFAGEALAGKFLGAGDLTALKRVIRNLMGIGLVLAIACSAVYMLCGSLFISMLTDIRSVQLIAFDYLPWIVAVPVCGFMAFIWDGIYIGMTLTRRMVMTMGMAMAVFFAVYFALSPSLSNHGLWIAFLSYLLCRGIIQTAIFPRRFPRHKK